MNHSVSSEGDSDVECGQVTEFGQVAKLPLAGGHSHGWDTGSRPVQLGFRDLTSPEENSEWDRSVSESEMGFFASIAQLNTGDKVTRVTRQGFQDLLSPDVANSSEPEDEPFRSRSTTVLEAALLPKHRKEYRADLAEVVPLHDNTKYTRVPEEGRWSEPGQSTSPMEQSFVGDLNQHPPVVEYNPPPSVGEYPQPPSVGEYSQPPSVGEYSQPPSVQPSSRSSLTGGSCSLISSAYNHCRFA